MRGFRWAGAALILAIALHAAHASAEEKLVFVVNAKNPVSSLPSREIVEFFLKKRTRWPDGTPVRFIDWRAGSAARRQFLQDFVDKSPREIELYWIGQKLYSGNSAPITVTSGPMVLAFVSRFEGAIGYLPASQLEDSPEVKRIEVAPNR